MTTITIYGPGCARCKQTEQIIRQVIKQDHPEVEITKVTEPREIAAAGILSTPAVAIDRIIAMSGRIPKTEEVRRWLAVNVEIP